MLSPKQDMYPVPSQVGSKVGGETETMYHLNDTEKGYKVSSSEEGTVIVISNTQQLWMPAPGLHKSKFLHGPARMRERPREPYPSL